MKQKKRGRKAAQTRRKLLLIGILSLCVIAGCITTVALVKILDGDTTSPTTETADVKENKMASHNDGNLLHNVSFIKVDVDLSKQKEIPEGTKLVALTFDDGPGYGSTERILAVLEKYNAKATWFCLGSKVAENPEMLKKIHKAGHQIESHSYSHPNLTLLSESDISAEIQDTNSVIDSVIGKKPKYLRPPYGEYNETVQAIAGLGIAMWNVDSRDWESRNGDAIYDTVMTYVHPGSVVLFHDIYDTTADGVERVVAALAEQGYTFVTYEELMSYQGA